MVTSNGSSPTKTQVYESLYLINHASQLMIEHMDRLKSAKVLGATFVQIRQAATRQLRAEIASSAVHNLAAPENAEAYRYQNQHIRMETRLARMKPKAKSRPR